MSKCSAHALLFTLVSLTGGLRRSRNDTQRCDDLHTSSTGVVTVSGCECRNTCYLSTRLNCKSKPVCSVDKAACPGAKHGGFGIGYYDFCHFPDKSVTTTSAAARHATLITMLKSDPTPQEFFGGIQVLKGVRGIKGSGGESVIDSMEMEPDVFPYARKKYVRPVGVVAPVRFVSRGGHDYTGIFKGNDLGIVRLSLSLEPTERKGFAPGIALKFLRQGRISANIFGFHDFVGQKCSEKNFFQDKLYTNVPPATGFATKIPGKFTQATGCHQMIGLSDAADEFDGQTPNFPFALIFQGLPNVDFSCGDKGAQGWANLGKLTKGTAIYTVKAQQNPQDEFVEIGDIILEDSLTTSKFGDEELFFRHQRKEEDFAIHPEWLSAIDLVKDCGTDFASTEPPKPELGCKYLV